MMKLLYKSINGNLYSKNAYGFPNPFVLADWDYDSGYVSISLDGNRLQINGNSNNILGGVLRCNKVSDLTKVCVFVRMVGISGNPRFGINCHIDDIGLASGDVVALTLPCGVSGNGLLNEYVNGVYNGLDSQSSVNVPLSTYVNFFLFADGAFIVGYDTYTTKNWSGVSALTIGKLGICTNVIGSVSKVNNFNVFTDRYLKINGLSMGDTVEIRNTSDSVVISDLESGGEVSFDVLDFLGQDPYYVVIKRGGADYASFYTGPWLYLLGGDTYTLVNSVNVIPNAQIREDSRYVNYNGKMYITSLSNLGDAKIHEIVPSTGEIKTEILGSVGTADDHCNSKLLIDSSGNIWVFYSLHNVDTNLYYYKTSIPGDITSFGSLQTISGMIGTCTHTHPFRSSNGRVIVFTRSNNVLPNGRWQIAWSDNNGSSWSNREFLGTQQWTYLNFFHCPSNVNRVIVGLWYSSPQATPHDVRVFEINLVTGAAIKPDGTSIGNIYSGPLINPDDTLTVHDGDSTHHFRVIDINEDYEMITTEHNPLSYTEMICRYVKIDNGVDISMEILQTSDVNSELSSDNQVGGRFFEESTLCLNYYDSADWMIKSFKKYGSSWYSKQIDEDPTGLLLAKRWPIPSIDFRNSDYLLYARDKSWDHDKGIWTRDVVLKEFSAPLIVIDFDGTPNEGFSPLTVQFVDRTEGIVVTTWLWEFGDGNTSTLPNPVHTYLYPGVYTVKLTINGTESEIKEAYIAVYEELEGDILFNFDEEKGFGDIFIECADLKRDPGFETAVFISLFTDKRAEDSDALPNNQTDKRGWWGDNTLGSKLWLIEREKLLNEAKTKAEQYSKEALQWLIDEGIAETILTEAVLRRGEAALILNIQIIQKSGEPIYFKYYYNWEAQIARRA